MPEFEYRFINLRTGRSNKRRGRAADEATLRYDLALVGIEPIDVTELAEPLATERQIALLADRGIVVPAGATMADASNMIDNLFKRRPVADQADFDLARRLGVGFNRYASKATIFGSILSVMAARGDEALGAWFAYRVYRNGMDRTRPGIGDPLDPRFAEIGRRIAADPRLVKSLRAAATSSFVDFRWFGVFVDPEGHDRHGDAKTTQVYRFTEAALRASGLLASGDAKSSQAAPAGKPKGSGGALRGDAAAASAAGAKKGLSPLTWIVIALICLAMATWLFG